jgi:hypothetical protein
MIIDYAKEIEYLNKVRKGEIKEGYGLGIPEIDEHFRLKKRNINVILGHANVGKTTVILALMLAYAKRHNMKWLVFSSENEPHSIIRKLVEFQCRKPINKIEQELYSEAMAYVVSNFEIISSEKLYTYRDIMKEAKDIRKDFNFSGMMLDPYNSLMKDTALFASLGGHEYDYQAMTEMRQFCKSEDFALWINVHAVTTALRLKHPVGHEYAGHPIPPLAADAEGGGKFVNRADDFLVIHRYTQHLSDWVYSDIHVRKIKEVETGGRPTPLEAPIRLKSIVNNVGFEKTGKPLILPVELDQDNIPF